MVFTRTAARHRAPGKLAAFSGVVFAVFLSGIALAPGAFAHHPDVSGSASCAGVVTFTSTSWAAPTAPERSNASIAIAYSTNGGTSFVTLPAKATYRFDSANNFQFSDSFTPPAGWSSLLLRATALSAWGDGAAAGDTRTSAAITPASGCTTPAAPSAAIADATCSAAGAVVHLANTGGAPVAFTITGGTSPTTTTVAAGATKDVTVALAPTVTATVTVTAPGMTTVTRQVSYQCAAVAPAAAPSATVDSTSSGALVHLENPGPTPAVFTIRPCGPDAMTTVPPGSTADVPVSIAPGTTCSLTVASPGMAEVLGVVQVAATPAALVAPATATAAAGASPRALPRTGAPTTVLVLAAAMLVFVGGSLTVASRARLRRS